MNESHRVRRPNEIAAMHLPDTVNVHHYSRNAVATICGWL